MSFAKADGMAAALLLFIFADLRGADVAWERAVFNLLA
jgi:hypothetical protein